MVNQLPTVHFIPMADQELLKGPSVCIEQRRQFDVKGACWAAQR